MCIRDSFNTLFCTSCLRLLVIPVTVASAQHSFSKMKLIIKTYLRASISQVRLTELAMLSIERKRYFVVVELFNFAGKITDKKHAKLFLILLL